MSRARLASLAALLYLSQGFPFGVVTDLMPIYLRVSGFSLQQIGLLQTVALAWTWKVLWAPLVDAFGTYRRWIAGTLVALSGGMLALAFVPPENATLIWAAIAVVAFASATQDIAIDALAIRITPTQYLGWINSVRVAAFRGAFILAGGGLAALSDVAGWRGAFLAGAAFHAAILAFTALLPRERGLAETRSRNPFAGLTQWLARPRALLYLAIIVTYRLADSALTPMAKTYWIDRKFSATEVGMVTTTLGIAFLILGALAGGWFIERYGVWRSLLWLGVAQMLSNAGYAIVAATNAGRPGMYTAAIIENFAGGLGTGAFLAFLMSICDRDVAATQYAMLSALFSFSRSMTGSISGFGAAHFGYTTYFWLSAALGIPGLLLVALALRGERTTTNAER